MCNLWSRLLCYKLHNFGRFSDGYVAGIAEKMMGCGHICCLMRIMFCVPTNTGWVERACVLEINIKRAVPVLKLSVKEPFAYKKEVNVLKKIL